MNKIKRFFNQNRKVILIITIMIISAFVGLRLLNYFVRIQNEEKKEEKSNITRTYNRDYEIASGESKDEDSYYLENELIERFLNYCNDKDFEKAYNIIAQDCKDALFPNLETFVKEYGEKIFDKQKDYNIQAWNSNTYRVRITEDLLSTGQTGDENYIEDYISINGSEKLNINNYLSTIKMYEEQDKANVNISIRQVEVKNNRDTSIMLNTPENSENVYLLTDDESKYVAFLHELSDDELIIGAGESQNISMKFDIPYLAVNKVVSFNLDNVIANYEQYKEIEGSRIIQFSIDI